MKILKRNAKFYSNKQISNLLDSDKFSNQVKDYCTKKLITVNYNSLKEMGLVEFEIFQLLNLCPAHIIDLQLVIEEMESRYDEDALNKFIDLFKK